MSQERSQIFVQVAAGSEEEAWTVAKTVVERKLAACAQILPMRSCYKWEGKIVEDNEYLVLIKSRYVSRTLRQLGARI